jgi:hypothetical protein
MDIKSFNTDMVHSPVVLKSGFWNVICLSNVYILHSYVDMKMQCGISKMALKILIKLNLIHIQRSKSNYGV